MEGHEAARVATLILGLLAAASSASPAQKTDPLLHEFVLQRCCTVGSVWATNHTTCTGPPLPLQGITAEERSSCLTAIYICCIKIHRQLNCERGKVVALSGQVCTLLATPGGEAHKDCCDGCSLGLKAARKRQQCSLSSSTSFGSPWDESYTECCITSTSQGTLPLTPRKATGRCATDSPCSQLCNEVGDVIQCSCYPGFLLSHDQRSCVDVNECERGSHSCNVNTETCVNTNGGFQCVEKSVSPRVSSNTAPGQCPTGYLWNQERQTCDDIDECSHDVCPPNRICTNTVGSFACILHNSGNPCPSGFRQHPTINNCIDIDECAEGLHRCDGTQELCLNSHGSYQCLPKAMRSKDCPAGLKWSSTEAKCEDVNECVEELHNCEEPTEVCRNTIGGYDCDPRCPQGQVYDLEQQTCKKKESCAQNPSICEEDQMCVHVGGVDYACVKRPVILCPTGYKPEAAASGLPETCIDVDECAENLDTCDRVSEKCVNYAGSYGCLPKERTLQQISCQSGFKYDSEKSECKDVDECQLNLDHCNRTVELCVNTNGSFLCQEKPPPVPDQCPPGYRTNPITNQCVDIDECEESRHHCLQGKEECLNVPGAYRCQAASGNCPAGFRHNATNGACDDVDECSEGSHNCDLQTHFCVNAPGEFQCIPMPTCRHGYVFNVLQNSCVDVDECLERKHTCNDITQECENTMGSYRCTPKAASCPHGYRQDLYTDHCQDVNECTERIDDCDRDREICINTLGSFQCQSKAPVQRCGTGYRNEGGLCKDINECEESQPCPLDQMCENTEGSYQCYCAQGYTLDTVTKTCKDVNECQLSLHSCSASQRCGNTIGSYTCVRIASCGTGYTLNAHTDDCEDDDECAIGSHNCGPGFACRNLVGSFRCDRVRCPSGQKLLPDGTCQVVVCSAGMESDPLGNCVDINECAVGNFCRPNQRCINSVGSYRCQNLINCGAGYELNEFGTQCVDIDECADRTHECAPQQLCRNVPGGYVCECPPGYSLNNERHCEDINECTRYRGQVCSITSECQNTPGSYVCDCKPGFKKAEDNKNCIDVDECTELANICQQSCINVWGSYQCSCQQGYTLASDGRTCQDINECTMWEGRGSLCIGNCVNEPGSYSCSCPEGYRIGADKRTCQDIDECEEQAICRGENEVCLNTRGSFKCNIISCPSNYVRDRDHRNVRGSHDTVMCRKKCKQNDIECTLNETQTITYQGIALPAIQYLPVPLILTTMRAVATGRAASDFRTDYRILEGNSDFAFDVLKRPGVGSLRLVKPIVGPQERNLKVLMVIQHGNQFRFSTMSHHLAILQISVSQYDF